MKLQIFLSTNDGTIFIFVTQKNNDIKSQAEESVMLGFNPGIYFLDIRVKPEYDREEAEDDIKEAALKRDSSYSVIPVLLFFPVIPVLGTGIKPLPAMPIGLLLGAGAASILLINGIMLPLYYRFGAEKARMLYMLMFAGMGAALGGGMVLMDAVPEPGAAIAIVGVLAAVLVLYALSWRLSVAWYGKYKK